MSQERSSQSPSPTDPQPQHIQVQHVLVGFSGSVPGTRISRTKEEARALAYEILGKAEDGADFDALVREHTDDSPPGIYGMSNRGVQPSQGEYPRDGMVGAFGNVGFALKVISNRVRAGLVLPTYGRRDTGQ